MHLASRQRTGYQTKLRRDRNTGAALLTAKLNVRTHPLYCLFTKHDTVTRNGFSIRTYGTRNKKLVSP